ERQRRADQADRISAVIGGAGGAPQPADENQYQDAGEHPGCEPPRDLAERHALSFDLRDPDAPVVAFDLIQHAFLSSGTTSPREKTATPPQVFPAAAPMRNAAA